MKKKKEATLRCLVAPPKPDTTASHIFTETIKTEPGTFYTVAYLDEEGAAGCAKEQDQPMVEKLLEVVRCSVMQGGSIPEASPKAKSSTPPKDKDSRALQRPRSRDGCRLSDQRDDLLEKKKEVEQREAATILDLARKSEKLKLKHGRRPLPLAPKYEFFKSVTLTMAFRIKPNADISYKMSQVFVVETPQGEFIDFDHMEADQRRACHHLDRTAPRKILYKCGYCLTISQ